MIIPFLEDKPLLADPITQRLVERAKVRGHVMMGELNAVFPDEVTSEQIETAIKTIESMGIKILEEE